MLALAEQVVVDQTRPDQVVGTEQLEGACHLPGVQIALVPHDVFEKRDLRLIDEKQQLTRLGEVGLVASRVRLASRSSRSRAMVAAVIAASVPPRQ